jgi:hypothetical protein
MQANIAVSLGYTAALQIWMFLYFLVQDELVTSSEERKEQGTNQAILCIETSSL